MLSYWKTSFTNLKHRVKKSLKANQFQSLQFLLYSHSPCHETFVHQMVTVPSRKRNAYPQKTQLMLNPHIETHAYAQPEYVQRSRFISHYNTRALHVRFSLKVKLCSPPLMYPKLCIRPRLQNYIGCLVKNQKLSLMSQPNAVGYMNPSPQFCFINGQIIH